MIPFDSDNRLIPGKDPTQLSLWRAVRAGLVVAVFGLVVTGMAGCGKDETEPATEPPPSPTAGLSTSDVQTVVAQGVETAKKAGIAVTLAVSDREGNLLGSYSMAGSGGDPVEALTKARTGAFLSSNEHGFTTLTACFITRPHFPPGVANTPAGPLFGVGFSSLPGGDIQPNGSALNDTPGGVPIYKNGLLVGGVGVSGAGSGFDPALCAGVTGNETASLGAVAGFTVSAEKRGDRILIDGIRFLFANASPPTPTFTAGFDLSSHGTFTVGPAAAAPPKFPRKGEVRLGGAFNFPIIAGSRLSKAEVAQIIQQASDQAKKTRAAIRAPLGRAAQVFISVVDVVEGKVLGIWRTPDATLFSFDVSAQKARTALAFSDPSNPDFGGRIRGILGLTAGQPFAVTTRAIGFLAQDFFPPGIDDETLGVPVRPGPLFEGPNFAYQARVGLSSYGNGITIFPGGIPLYKDGVLSGAIGISGDGVDQDDLIAFAGSAGFEPAEAIRSDQFSYDGVRLPYVKLPRQPEL
jgi:uncharacterized protein GlcG (DUF336 family)